VSAAGSFLHTLQNELGGSIPVERFMAEALYNPAFGYYSTRIHSVGRHGDFSTMATLDQSLARRIATWIQKENCRDVIEIGAGSGQLAHSILQSLGWWKRQRIRYHIVEISPPLQEVQKKLLQGRSVTWHDSLPSALEHVRGTSHIFSNELVDAFPCRVFELADEGWQELHIRIAGGRIEEILKPATLPDSTIFKYEFAKGQRIEVHESYRDWLEMWAPYWKAGAMLTIDYGDTMPALHHRRRLGSMRGYAAHQRLTGPDIYQAPGRCDLTADVNFSDLEKWSLALGWRTLTHCTLDKFIGAGLDARFQAASNTFRVLEQSPPLPVD
jgi:SAM-dependent MidA family methyltransferase